MARRLGSAVGSSVAAGAVRDTQPPSGFVRSLVAAGVVSLPVVAVVTLPMLLSSLHVRHLAPWLNGALIATTVSVVTFLVRTRSAWITWMLAAICIALAAWLVSQQQQQARAAAFASTRSATSGRRAHHKADASLDSFAPIKFEREAPLSEVVPELSRRRLCSESASHSLLVALEAHVARTACCQCPVR